MVILHFITIYGKAINFFPFIILEMKGQVECIALWDTVSYTVCSECILHILN